MLAITDTAGLRRRGSILVPLDIAKEVTILDPKAVRLYRNRFQELCLRIHGGEEHSKVNAVRAFPLSDPDHFISFHCEKGDPIGMIGSAEDLDAHSKGVLDEGLARAYFMPKIVEIRDIKEEFGSQRWEVQTDRGPRAVEIRHREDLRSLPGRRVIIRDVDGSRFEIPDYGVLDSRSRTLLEAQI